MNSSFSMIRSEAIAIIEGFGSKEVMFDAVKQYFEQELKNGEVQDHEKRGENYYYLLRILIRKHIMVDNPVTQQFFDHMTKEFFSQEHVLLDSIHLPSDIRNMQMKRTQLKAFYKLLERYFVTLELEFGQNGFVDFREKAYLEKMRIRRKRYFLQKAWGRYLIYSILDISSNFGMSLMRWLLTTLSIIFGFSFYYYCTDFFGKVPIVNYSKGYFVFDYLYFSLMSFTTLSFGDLLPHTLMQRIGTSLEVFLGYLMLGMLMTIISKRL